MPSTSLNVIFPNLSVNLISDQKIAYAWNLLTFALCQIFQYYYTCCHMVDNYEQFMFSLFSDFLHFAIIKLAK